MKITIVHLYNDLLNLYGESGNILALTYALNAQGVDVEIKNISLNDKIDLSDADFVYIGSGTEEAIKVALSHMKKYSEEITNAYISNKMFLATGNSIHLFGKSINDNNSLSGLGLFGYEVNSLDKRFVSECIFKCNDLTVLGFENHEGKLSSLDLNPLFTVEKGYASNENTNFEGFHEKNFYGTYLIGPLLARNPKLLEIICKEIILSKDKGFKFKSFDFDFMEKAFQNYLRKYDK